MDDSVATATNCFDHATSARMNFEASALSFGLISAITLFVLALRTARLDGVATAKRTPPGSTSNRSSDFRLPS